jgi:hypothetical protein
MMDAEELVTVYTVTNPAEAELIRNLLVAEGIPAEISGENQAALTGVLEIAILTKAIDADRAREVIMAHPHRAPGGGETGK